MKRNRIICTMVVICLITISTISVAFAKDYGGWDEKRGNYTIEPNNVNSFLNSVRSSAASSPYHYGQRESTVINGTTNYRAAGLTSWPGVYHYTRARMETGNVVLTDSDRVWGFDFTMAASPWWAFNPDIDDQARTYYGM